ncbi:MAG TPA: hypothetical protein VF220_08685, partial [Nitrososphaeraceae archaeon]
MIILRLNDRLPKYSSWVQIPLPELTIKGLYSLNVLYDIMCFEFEIPNMMKSKNLNVINEEDVEIEP